MLRAIIALKVIVAVAKSLVAAEILA